MTLRAKLLGLFAILGVVPPLALGVLTYARSMEALERLIRSRTDAIAQQTANEIRQRYAQRQSDLLLLAGNAETRNLLRAHAGGSAAAWTSALATADPYLRQAWGVVGSAYQWLEFRDPTGTVLYALGSAAAPAADQVEMAQPIEDLEVPCDLGTLVTAVHLGAVLPYERLESSFGQTGYSVVLDRERNLVLHHPLRAFRRQSASRLLGPEGWRVDGASIDEDRGGFTFVDGSSVRVASFVSLTSPAWTVISTASLDEFAGPFARTRTVNLLLVVLVSAAIAVAFFVTSRQVTRSLEGLTAAADEIARGNFTPRLPPAGSDEVGRLSSAFRVMATEVGNMFRRIEQSRHMAAIGQFASQLAHEVRNPLTSIKLNLQSLERDAVGGRLPADCARPLQICLKEIDRLDRVVRSALSLARTPGSFEASSVHACVREALDVLRAQLDGRGIAVETEFRAARDTVLGAPEALKGVFVNLLLNGADAMPGGGIIRVRTDTKGSAIRARVIDGGPGVPPELKDRIFEPFFSTKKEGTGFGLAVALQTVEAHGGTLALADDEADGPGAAFVVELPLAQTAQTP